LGKGCVSDRCSIGSSKGEDNEETEDREEPKVGDGSTDRLGPEGERCGEVVVQDLRLTGGDCESFDNEPCHFGGTGGACFLVDVLGDVNDGVRDGAGAMTFGGTGLVRWTGSEIGIGGGSWNWSNRSGGRFVGTACSWEDFSALIRYRPQANST
jgi:hypothetical protein